jgi:hypothetical protein
MTRRGRFDLPAHEQGGSSGAGLPVKTTGPACVDHLRNGHWCDRGDLLRT